MGTRLTTARVRPFLIEVISSDTDIAATYTVQLQWDTTQSSKHALDYLEHLHEDR